MYLRTKKVKGKTYYYLVEYSKVNGKIKQKMVAYLGNAEKVKEMFDFYQENKDQRGHKG
ncbi:MAG: hypothetical protein AABX72_03490 [Nanoarchaeota archaeon]